MRARALTVQPAVLVADEPVSALDVSIQAQVLNLFVSLRRELGLTILMITHDLRVANFLSDRIAVLYRGRLVELGTRKQIMEHARHPYTRLLLSAAPSGDPTARQDRPWLTGGTDRYTETGGCVFSDRCWLRKAKSYPAECVSEQPQLRVIDGRQQAACHFAEDTISEAAPGTQPHSTEVTA